MNVTVDLIPLTTPKDRRPGRKRTPLGIVVHNTGNPNSTARGERAWLTNKTNTATASYNYAVDATNIIQCIPDDEVTYNAGDGYAGAGNVSYIAIEICESGNYQANEENAIQLIIELMERYHFTTANIKPHKFFSGKECPRKILPYWDTFLKRIQTAYDAKYRFVAPAPVEPTIDAVFQTDVQYLASVGQFNSPQLWATESYTKDNVKSLIHKFAEYVRSKGGAK